MKTSHLLRYCGIDSFEVSKNGERVLPASNSHTAILCLGGAGTIGFTKESLNLSPGEAYFLAPGQALTLLADGEPLKGYFIRFEVYSLRVEELHSMKVTEYMDGQIRTGNQKLLAESCDLLLRLQTEALQDGFSGQAELYRIMSLLAEGRTKSQEEVSTDAAIARVSGFMEQNWERELTRKELARLAGFSPGYFSLAFQEHTGVSPLAYLMDIRIKRAKDLLLSGGGVKETAIKVGFNDEFYFSRRFKQKTGFSPLAFVRSRRRSIASVSDPISGSLMALSLLPKAAAFYPNHEQYSRMIRLHSDEEGQGAVWDHNLKLLKEAGPELIFCTDILNERARQQLERIAPTVPIPWLSVDWRQQLLTIADAADQREEGASWLSEYDRRAETVYRKVRSKIGGATLNIWRIMGSEYRIYGGRNAGAVLYGDLKLAATHNLDQISVFDTVSKEALIDYDADVLLIMVDSTAQAARERAVLQSSELWSRLTAVRNGRVYEIETEKLFEYSAWSHDRALSYFMQMFS
ncbi:helix-turn-helix domain-containing protein [Cohnella abietis]|uniref:HTH-type transcriptional activator Btr n=1 Tax=Cohnella abietis TaxID=2507935 RepID=A0A3T1CYB5_9BACL|nr:helix-turn-helix domain-containing protein [Cohnella abietis]BBI30830.1 HTH-type transcriptional activator Btr [Cohnella abietis]